jgi:hypothetical protein
MERWAEANWTYVRGEIGRVAAAIEGALSGKAAPVPAPTQIPRELVERAPAIVRLCQAFELGAFERDVVLACAGGELDAEFARRTGLVRPSLGLALAAFPGGHVGVLAASAPLRRYRIVEPLDGSPLVAAPLVLDDRIAQFIAGSDGLDARLARSLREVVVAIDDASEIVPQVRAACELAGETLVVGLSEGGERERQATALAVCRGLGRRLFRVRSSDLPVDAPTRHLVRTLWERELRLQPLALLVEIEHDAPPEAVRTASALVHDLEGLAFMSARTPIAITRTSYVAFELPRPPRAQRVAHLRRMLGERAAAAGPLVERIATQFVLGSDALARACLSVESGAGPLEDRLWAACREQARPRLDDVARRIDPKAGWDDLVVPAETLVTLKALAAHIRHSAQVYEEWGFGAKANRGLGTGALFAGTSGTGKTLAAEILAGEAQLDLYHIDLSQIVNKYVGETEKNLRRVFDAAEDSGAILLFDEADSLFGKRGDVEKGTDRYANLEVSYLLQRMEAYRGLAILTTNQRDAIDSAFLRRLRFVISFPFPDAPLRVALWQRAFPASAPCAGIDVHRLARLQLPGGNIRNVAINAAFLAAERGEAISMRHVLSASRSEFQKIERPFPEIEVQGWLS